MARLDVLNAFEYYYSLNNSRNLQKVAEKFGVSLGTVKKAAAKHRWQVKLSERDAKVSSAVEDKIIASQVKDKANYRNVLRVYFGHILKRTKKWNDAVVKRDRGEALTVEEQGLVNDPPIKFETPADFERLVKMDVFLLSNPYDLQAMEIDYNTAHQTAKLRAMSALLHTLNTTNNEALRVRIAEMFLKKELTYKPTEEAVNEFPEYENVADEELISTIAQGIREFPNLIELLGGEAKPGTTDPTEQTDIHAQETETKQSA